MKPKSLLKKYKEREAKAYEIGWKLKPDDPNKLLQFEKGINENIQLAYQEFLRLKKLGYDITIKVKNVGENRSSMIVLSGSDEAQEQVDKIKEKYHLTSICKKNINPTIYKEEVEEGSE